MTECSAIHVLIIEDSDDDAKLLTRELIRGGYKPSITRVDTAADLDDALNSDDWDIILSDFSMPQFSGIRALEMVRKRNNSIPFIFVSGTIGEDTAVSALKAGAQDYIMKDNLKRLIPAIQREIREAEGVAERKRAEEKIRYLAHHDPLTGLPNRTLFLDRLEQSMREATRFRTNLGLIFIDLDRFKPVNDTLGHQAGDAVLREVSRRLIASVRSVDVVARLAGDEFTVTLTNISHPEDAARIAEKILDGLAPPFQFDQHEFYLDASLGISIFPHDGTDAETLLKNADIAMYRAKYASGSHYHFYLPDMTSRAGEQLALESALRHSLEQDDFMLHYQPQFDTRTRQMTSAEALVRWPNTDGGMRYPDSFIPLAEKTRLILPLGQWVLKTACQQAQSWANSAQPLRIAVNCSACQLRDNDFVTILRTIMEQTGIAPNLLEIEITESVLIEDAASTLAMLCEIRNLGVRLSLDDFGTGYSSLSYLKRFPIDMLKIDRSFISNVATDDDNAAITSAIIAMAKRLKIEVVAEGVETEEQFTFLANEGCDLIQGFLLGKPMSADALTHAYTSTH